MTVRQNAFVRIFLTIQSRQFALAITVHPNLIHVLEPTVRIDLIQALVAALVPIVRSQRPVRVQIVVQSQIHVLDRIVPNQTRTTRIIAPDQIVSNQTRTVQTIALDQTVRTQTTALVQTATNQIQMSVPVLIAQNRIQIILIIGLGHIVRLHRVLPRPRDHAQNRQCDHRSKILVTAEFIVTLISRLLTKVDMTSWELVSILPFSHKMALLRRALQRRALLKFRSKIIALGIIQNQLWLNQSLSSWNPQLFI